MFDSSMTVETHTYSFTVSTAWKVSFDPPSSVYWYPLPIDVCWRRRTSIPRFTVHWYWRSDTILLLHMHGF